MGVWNIAHRGGAGLRAENTLAAFAHAIALGADGAELDVQLSKDGEVVVFHDYRLKAELCRGPDGPYIRPPGARIKDLTLAELRGFDIGRPDDATAYAQSHPDLVPVDGEKIPTLSEVISIAAGAPKPFRLFVELKTSFAERDLSADPVALAEATIAVLRAGNYLDRAILVGFDWPGLLHARAIAPQVECWFTTLAQSWFRDGQPPPFDDPPSAPALQMLRHWASTGTSPWAGGFDAVRYGGSILAAIQAAGGTGWFPTYTDINAESVAEARRLGLKVGAWTVNDPKEMRRLSALGVDAICTDKPDVLAGLQQSRS